VPEGYREMPEQERLAEAAKLATAVQQGLQRKS
jgi:hypothetical protein